jgi:hypothetical protein
MRVTMVPPPGFHTAGRVLRTRDVPTCWVVVERDGYSVHATPYTSEALAKLAYERAGIPPRGAPA